jgi:hypothetical protein
MNQFGESDSVEPVDQDQPSESSGSDPDAISSLPNRAGRSAESATEPRFGISHMMVWIACCAVYMGIMRFSWPEAMLQNIPHFFILSTALGSLSGGAFLAGVILFAERRFRGATFPLHAGEWLLTVQGIRFAISQAIFGVARLVSEDTRPYAWAYSSLIFCWLFLWPALRAQDPPRWKGFFWSLLLVDLLQGLNNIFLAWMSMGHMISVGLIYLVRVGLLLGCIWLDWQVPLRRPWTHWAGVLAFLWGSTLHLVLLGVVVVGPYLGWHL